MYSSKSDLGLIGFIASIALYGGFGCTGRTEKDMVLPVTGVRTLGWLVYEGGFSLQAQATGLASLLMWMGTILLYDYRVES